MLHITVFFYFFETHICVFTCSIPEKLLLAVITLINLKIWLQHIQVTHVNLPPTDPMTQIQVLQLFSVFKSENIQKIVDKNELFCIF